MSKPLLAAITRYRQASDEFLDAMERYLVDQNQRVDASDDRAQPPPKAAPKPQATPARPVAKPSGVVVPGSKPLPDPVTPAPNKMPTLDPKTKATSLKAATTIAERIIRGVGSDSLMLQQGLRGQLALERVPFDDEVVSEAIDLAKAKFR